MIPGLGGLPSVSSSSSTGPTRSGDVGGSSFSFGGINTGQQNSALMWVGIAAAAALVAWLVFRKK